MKCAGDPGASVWAASLAAQILSPSPVASCLVIHCLPVLPPDGAIPVFFLESDLPVLNICLFCLSKSDASGSHGTIPIFIIVCLGQLQPLFQDNFIFEIVNVF